MITRLWPRLFLLVLTVFTPACATADTTAPTRQQLLFKQTREQMARGQWSQAKQNMAALKNYSLYPYLELAVLSDRLGALPADDVDDFLARYPDR